ncbi:C1 family peptidase, partial [Chloroflexota bacterium]
KLPSEAMAEAELTTEPPPATLDWRDKDGGDWTTSIKNQGQCGSCWAFGSIGAMESQINIAANEPTIDMDLSEQYLLSCSGGSCNGWSLEGTLDFLRDTGTTDEAAFPYKADDKIPCGTATPFIEGRKWKLDNWGWVSLGTPTPDEIKAYLQERPLVTGFNVYEDFLYYSGGIYKHVTGKLLGGHAVSMVGWNDAEQYWICKNSWGTDWGENGWFRIEWGQGNIEYSALYSNFELTKRAISGDAAGTERDFFNPGHDVYVKALGLSENTTYNVWVQPDPVTEGNTLNPAADPSGIQETITTDTNGNLLPKLIWSIPADAIASSQNLDIILDKAGTGEGTFNQTDDAIDAAPAPGIKFVPFLDSYSDPAHNTFCDNFNDYNTEHTVYIHGFGFTPNYNYKVAYYDGSGTLKATEAVSSNSSGAISSQHEFIPGRDIAGKWLAIVCDGNQLPPNIFDQWPGTLMLRRFNVEQSAISITTITNIHSWINTPYVEGYTVPRVEVNLVLKDSSGNIKAIAITKSDDDGWFKAYFEDSYGHDIPIVAGDTVEVTPQGGTTSSVNVVALTAMVDVATNTVSGTAPAESTIGVQVCRDKCSYQEVIASSSGNYTVVFPDISREDSIRVSYYHPDGHIIFIQLYAPIVKIRVNSNYVTGITTPNVDVSLVLRDSSGNIKANATYHSSYDGYFYAYFRDGSGNDVPMGAGDTVEVTPDAGEVIFIDVVGLTGEVDVDADTVFGTAPPNSTIEVMVSNAPRPAPAPAPVAVPAPTPTPTPAPYGGGGGSGGGCWHEVTVDSSGNYTTDFSDEIDIRRGNRVEVHYINPDEHVVFIEFYTPIVRVEVNSNYIRGYTTPNVDVSLVLRDSSGDIKANATYHSWYDGYFYTYFRDSNDNNINILSGDTVEVTPPGGNTVSVKPLLTIQADINANTVFGTAPPNSSITVFACGDKPALISVSPEPVPPPPAPAPMYCYARTVTTDSQGNYLTNFSKEINITADSKINAWYYDTNDNYVYIYWEPSLVNLYIQPSKKTLSANETFTLTIKVEAGSQPVAGIQAFINFDPYFLAVQDSDNVTPGIQITPGTSLPNQLLNSANNTTGIIDYVAGIALTDPSGPCPSGSFTLATITLKALAETEDTTAIRFYGA